MAFVTETSIYSLHVPNPKGEARVEQKLRGTQARLISMSKIVEETGGEMLDVDKFQTTSDALAAMVSALRTRYTLGYNLPGKPDGELHKIRVELGPQFGRAGTEYVVQHRRGYRRGQATVPSTTLE